MVTLSSSRTIARAHARAIASRTRFEVGDIRRVLIAAGEVEAAAAAHLAFEALTRVIADTYDGPQEVFA